MANRKVYRKNGQFYDQDPVYDSEMKKQGYEEATPEESAVYLADQREAKPYSPEEVIDDRDNALADEIEFAARAQNQQITREQALDRARNVRSILGEEPVYPYVEGDTPPSDAGDIGGTIVDSVLGGLAFGIPKLAVRKLADAYDPTSYFSTREMERRAKANPALSFGIELGTGLLQGGVGAAKTGLMRVLAKEAGEGALKAGAKAVGRGAVTALAETDIAGKATSAVGRKIGTRFLGKGAETLAKGEALGELTAIEAKAAAGAELTAAEKELLDAVNALEGLGTLGQQKGFAKIVEDRTTALLEQRLAEQYTQQGLKGAAARVVASTISNALVGGAAGAVSAAEKKSMERDLPRLSAQDQAGFFEDYGAAMLRGAGEGAAAGTALSLGIPLASKGLGLGLTGVRKVLRGVTEKTLPVIGSILTKTKPADIQMGVIAADKLADISIAKENKALIKALQYQYDYAESYLAHIKEMKAQLGDTSDLGNDLGAVMEGVRKKFMVRNGDGKLVYDAEKMRKALESSKVIAYLDGAGNKQIELQLPAELQALQDTIGSWEQTLIALENETGGRTPFMAMEGTPPIDTSKVPLGVLPPTIIPDKGVQAAPLAMAGTGTRRGLSFPSMSDLGGTDAGRLATIGNRYDAIARLGAERTKPLSGELVDVAKELGLGTLVAKELGASLPQALGGAAAVSFGLKALVNPNAAVSQFRMVQRAVGLSQEANKNFAGWVVSPTRGRAAAGEALRKTTTAAYKLYSGDTEESRMLNEPFSLAAGRQLYQMDKELLGRLNGPDALGNIDKVFGTDYQKLDASYPAAAQGTAGVTPKQVAFLNSKMPKVSGNQKPSDQQIYQYGLYSRYVRNPDAIYDDIVERNYVPSQAIEVLQQVYPTRYKQIQSQLFDAMAGMKERGETLDSKQQRIADTLLGRGNTAGLTAAQIRSLQQTIQLPTGKPQDFSSRRPELERQGTSLGK